jgi:hypothetical protein
MSKIEKLTMIGIDIVGLDWLDKIVAGTIRAVDLTGGRYFEANCDFILFSPHLIMPQHSNCLTREIPTANRIAQTLNLHQAWL